MDCCPLVIDPLTLTALLAFIAAATYFLWGWNMTLLTFEKALQDFQNKTPLTKSI